MFTTGARQRVIASSEIGEFARPGLVDPQRIVCTEPNPDAAVAVANSLGVGLSVLGQGSGSLSAQQVEGLAQLVERTASIQLLRDKMYQTCLAYANGAISGTTYSLIMSRLDDTIVTLLLGETAGGAFGRKQAGIGTAASAEAEATLVGFNTGMSDLKGAADELAAAEKDVAQKQKDLDAAEAKATEAKAADGEPSEPDQKAVDDAQADLDEAKARRDATLKLLQSRIDTSAEAAGKVSELKTGGGLSIKPDPRIARTLEDMQASFLADDYTDNYLSACLVELALEQEDRSPIGLTFDMLAAEVEAAKADLAKKPADTNRSARVTQAETALSGFAAKLADAEQATSTPNARLFSEFLTEWKDFPAESRIARGQLIAIANVTRNSKLSTFCREHLPDFLENARQDFETFRSLRETLRARVKMGETAARIREAEADRWAQFTQALETCATLGSDDQKICREIVLKGSLSSIEAAKGAPESEVTDPEVPAEPGTN